jgi:hypothetical protein
MTVARADLRDMGVEPEPRAALADGEARLCIDHFALTANNITYAAFGAAMRYWDFFPCSDPDRGCIPVWGFAEVSESRAEGVAAGERWYGFLPMGQELTVFPDRVNAAGFVDSKPHRRELPSVYNHYTRCNADPAWRADQEAQIALLRPLFSTAYLIDDFLDEADGFGADTVLMSSASSKTAWATAFCIAAGRRAAGAPRLVGLTSPGNRAYTEQLGLYDQVLSYDELPTLAPAGRVVYVDFSGSAPLRQQVHVHLGDRLAYSCAVGGTHWEALGADAAGRQLPGPRPTLFFAPARMKQRVADWGAAGLSGRLAERWLDFMQTVNDPARAWLRVQRGTGADAVRQAYLAQLDGQVPADVGWFLSV